MARTPRPSDLPTTSLRFEPADKADASKKGSLQEWSTFLIKAMLGAPDEIADECRNYRRYCDERDEPLDREIAYRIFAGSLTVAQLRDSHGLEITE